MATDTETFRERLPIVAEMVDSAFNGDRKPGETTKVSFVVIAYEDGSNSEFAASMISNIREHHELISLFLSIISEYPPPRSGPVGHA
jgi:hypothetical protein